MTQVKIQTYVTMKYLILNLKFKRTKAKNIKHEDEMKAHVFYILSEEYKPVRVSWNVNISKMEHKCLKK